MKQKKFLSRPVGSIAGINYEASGPISITNSQDDLYPNLILRIKGQEVVLNSIEAADLRDILRDYFEYATQENIAAMKRYLEKLKRVTQ